MGGKVIIQGDSWNKKFLWEVFRAGALLVLPFCIYIHLWYSKVESDGLFIFNMRWEHNFESNHIFIWYLLKDLIPVLLLFIWYFSITHWWRHFILPITTLFLFSLLQVLGVVPMKPLHDICSWEFFLLLCMTLLLLLVGLYLGRKNGDTDATIHLPFQNKGDYKSFFKNHKAYYESLKSQRVEGAFEAHLKKLYSLEANLQEWIGRTTGIPQVHTPVNKRILEGVITFLLLALPIFRFWVTSIPSGQNSLSFLGITIESMGFYDVSSLLWFLCIKLMVLIPLCIWYVTCQNWWKYAILSPIILYAFQIWEAFQDQKILDAYGNIRAFPAVFVVVMVVVSLSIAVQYRFKILDLHQGIKLEIEALLGQMDGANHILAHQKKTFMELQRTKVTKETAQDYLQSLIKLRENLLRELEGEK